MTEWICSVADFLETRKIETQEEEVKEEDLQGQDQDLPKIMVAEGQGLEVGLGRREDLLETRDDNAVRVRW